MIPARWQYLIQEAGIGLRRNLLMTAAVILSVAVSLTLLGASLLVREQVQLVAGDWYGKVEVSIFLCDGRQCPAITDEQRNELRSALETEPLVQRVFYESKQEAYQRFTDQFSNQPELVQSVTADALPASFRVKLADPEQFQVIAQRFEAWPGVETIVDQGEFLDRLFSITDVFQVGAVVVAVIQLIAASVLIANTIRVAAFARREQISIMKLVGASNWYIRLPFVLEGVTTGFIGALVAWLLLLVSVPTVTGFLAERIPFTPFIGRAEIFLVAPWLFLCGIGIATVSSLVSLRRFLDV